MGEPKPTRTVFIQVIERPARKLLLKRGLQARDCFEYCEEAGCGVWALLTSVKEALWKQGAVHEPPLLINLFDVPVPFTDSPP